jgi:hypothetical protein
MLKSLFLIIMVIVAGVSAIYANDTDAITPDEPQYGLPASVIESYAPNIERIGVSDGILNRLDYRQVNGLVNVVDAPGSNNVLYSREARSYYVSVQQIVGEWAEINDGEWIPANTLGPVNPSRLNGVLFPDGIEVLEYPIGFTRRDVTFWSTRPGEEAPITNENAFGAYRMFHLFSDVEIDGELWYQVGVDQWLPASQINVLKPIERPEEIDTRIWIAADVENHFVMAYEDDKLVFAALSASGNPWTPTETGFYRIYLQYNSRYMTSGTPGDYWYYYVEDVPYTLYFNGDQAFHGVYWHDNFGVYQSNGCVNLSMNDAYWLFNWAVDYMFLEADGGSQWPMIYIYGEYPPEEEW